eukprot:TRINITY_DN4215_c0_g1_i1.p1 TRINITY_DN4215_c0_g1~~TRINITY_DN4215_c0_g1_i1.p1  ORF type:complete len:432 (-),score=80.89 TRINITY_DN4215_c0_g1_i1:793-2001(-)
MKDIQDLVYYVTEGHRHIGHNNKQSIFVSKVRPCVNRAKAILTMVRDEINRLSGFFPLPREFAIIQLLQKQCSSFRTQLVATVRMAKDCLSNLISVEVIMLTTKTLLSFAKTVMVTAKRVDDMKIPIVVEEDPIDIDSFEFENEPTDTELLQQAMYDESSDSSVNYYFSSEDEIDVLDTVNEESTKLPKSNKVVTDSTLSEELGVEDSRPEFPNVDLQNDAVVKPNITIGTRSTPTIERPVYDLSSSSSEFVPMEGNGKTPRKISLEWETSAEFDLETFFQLFNTKCRNGIEYLIEKKQIENEEDFKTLGSLLQEHRENLDKVQLGKLLAGKDEDDTDLMEAWTKLENFSGIFIDEALRLFLQGFMLPGESQVISRMMGSRFNIITFNKCRYFFKRIRCTKP